RQPERAVDGEHDRRRREQPGKAPAEGRGRAAAAERPRDQRPGHEEAKRRRHQLQAEAETVIRKRSRDPESGQRRELPREPPRKQLHERSISDATEPDASQRAASRYVLPRSPRKSTPRSLSAARSSRRARSASRRPRCFARKRRWPRRFSVKNRPPWLAPPTWTHSAPGKKKTFQPAARKR